jgi:protein-S-isoprenylcysteine O-methyltransferase Ste14
VTLVVAPLLLSPLLPQLRIEECQLVVEYGEEYIAYKSRVKAQLIPFIV